MTSSKSCRSMPKRSYPLPKVRGSGQEELPHVRGQGRPLRFGLRPQGPCRVGTGESGLVLSEEGIPPAQRFS